MKTQESWKGKDSKSHRDPEHIFSQKGNTLGGLWKCQHHP